MICDTSCFSTILHGDIPQKIKNLIFQGNKILELFDEERNMWRGRDENKFVTNVGGKIFWRDATWKTERGC
jgi:hypothetical protein